jgi:hypothetical protein
VIPVLESFKSYQNLLIGDIILEFNTRKGSGMKHYWVKFTGNIEY